MTDLTHISEPIKVNLDYFQSYFKKAVKSDVALLNIITNYILKSKGKQMRPMLVLFSAAMTGTINEKTYRAAALIELLHTATLVHDDVVDDSDKRRGLFSVNALWKNKAAVLVGDFLLSKGLLQSLENNDHDMLQIASDAIRKMSEGELLQLEKSRTLNIDENTYFNIIRFKTASLFAACCACGAASALADKAIIDKCSLLGETIGMAFQLKDDLFDFQKVNATGKPNGIDIKDKKITLPLIFLLNKSKLFEKKKYVNIIKNQNNNNDKLKYLISKVYESGGILYAEQKMYDYCERALSILHTFPDNNARQSLEKLINFTIQRTN